MTIQPQTTGIGASAVPGHEPANLGDILERVLDRGLVIVGDIRISLLDIELLTVKLRLLIASVDTARELGIDWWRHDPWLHGGAPDSDGDGDARRALQADGRTELGGPEEERPGTRPARQGRRDER